jgi:hypothetical protein
VEDRERAWQLRRDAGCPARAIGLTGLVGPDPALPASLAMGTGLTCLAGLGILTAGIAQLVSGHVIGLAPALLCWLPATAMTGFSVAGRRQLERDLSKLIEEVNGVLGSTAAFPGSSAVPADGRNGA